jgi:hypothetical protein
MTKESTSDLLQEEQRNALWVRQATDLYKVTWQYRRIPFLRQKFKTGKTANLALDVIKTNRFDSPSNRSDAPSVWPAHSIQSFQLLNAIRCQNAAVSRLAHGTSIAGQTAHTSTEYVYKHT